MPQEVSITFQVDERSPKTFDEMWSRALPELEEIDAKHQPTAVDDLLWGEIDGLASDCVPENRALFAVFGAEIFALLQEDVPGEDWARYLEGGGEAPNGTYPLYAIVKARIRTHLLEEAERLIAARLNPEVAAPGPLSRASSLAERAGDDGGIIL